MIIKRIATYGAVLAMTVTLAACGNGDKAASPSPQASASPSATPTVSLPPVEDGTVLPTNGAEGVVDGFAAWGIQRSNVDMKAITDQFGKADAETAVSTALVDLLYGHSSDQLLVAHDQSLVDVAWSGMSNLVTDNYSSKGLMNADKGQGLIPSSEPDGSFKSDAGVTYHVSSMTCAMNTVPSTAVFEQSKVIVRSLIECKVTTTEKVPFEYKSNIALVMIPSGSTALIDATQWDITLSEVS